MSCFRHYTLDASLPLRLRPESMEKLRCLRACVIRSLYHMYEPFAARISKNPAIPESTPSTLKNSKVSENYCWGLTNGLLHGGPVNMACLRLPWCGGLGLSIPGCQGANVNFQGFSSLRHSCSAGLASLLFTLKLSCAFSIFFILFNLFSCLVRWTTLDDFDGLG